MLRPELRTALAIAIGLGLTACPMAQVTGPGGDDAGLGSNNGSDAGLHNGQDAGGNHGDAATFPDATAEAEGYLISSGDGQPGAENSGTMPEGNPNSGCRIENFSGNTTFVPGGTNRFTGDVVGGLSDGLVVGFEELGGFYDVPISSASFAIFVTLGQNVSRSSLVMVITPRLAVTESQPQGGYCESLRVPVTVLQDVGTGDLQVSLSWQTDTDVDLHLVEPSGEEIYYGSRNSSSGGELDLDSHPACNDPKTNNENITYQNVTPPSGHYIVRVDYWSACQEAGQTDFVVTVNLRGEATVYQGSFGPADETGGGAGDGITVAEFDF